MEYLLRESKNTDTLPVKTSDLYFEIVNRFILDHNKKEVPSEDTLDKLSELAAQLLLENRFLFVEEDMKKFSSHEVKSLRASGLLHCGPPFRKSFSKVTKHFCFTHLYSAGVFGGSLVCEEKRDSLHTNCAVHGYAVHGWYFIEEER